MIKSQCHRRPGALEAWGVTAPSPKAISYHALRQRHTEPPGSLELAVPGEHTSLEQIG